jgi:hypothetical protein
MPDDKLAAFAVICTEEHTTQRIGVDVALEPHLRPALHVEDHARGAREVAEVGIIGHRSNVLLPACGKVPIQVERGPAESCGHASDYQLRERHRHRRGHLGSGAVAIPLSASTSVGA